MAKRLHFVAGDSGSGKSTLAAELKRCFGFEVLGVDGVYVGFVKDKWAQLYFDDLCRWIAPHYQMVAPNWGRMQDTYGGRQFVSEWEQYLETQIETWANDCGDKLVVEGWLLGKVDDREKLLGGLRSVASVYWLRVDKSHRCFLGGEELTLEQVAALGNDEESA